MHAGLELGPFYSFLDALLTCLGGDGYYWPA